jgi:hypothetical protein
MEPKFSRHTPARKKTTCPMQLRRGSRAVISHKIGKFFGRKSVEPATVRLTPGEMVFGCPRAFPDDFDSM